MSKIKQYTGARYVPRFMGTYDVTQQYEGLDVVDNGLGTSYIAKQIVPVGTPLTDRTYWALYGSSSGAVVDLQQQIDALTDDFGGIKDDVSPLKGGYVTVESFGAVGDGITDDTEAIQDALNSSAHTIVFTKSYLVKTDRISAPLTDGTDPSYCAVKITSPKRLIFEKATVKGYNELDDTHTGTDTYFIATTAPLEVIGLEYDGQRPTYRFQYGIQFNASNCVLRDCIFKNLGGSFAVFNGAEDSRLENICVDNVWAEDTGNSMFFAWCDYVFIRGISLHQTSEGFDFDKECTNVVIDGVVAHETRGGGADALIEINGGKKFTISNVTCVDYCDGILLNGKTWNGINYITEDIVISNCVFDNIVGYGFLGGNAIAGVTEVKNVRLNNVTVKNATLAGFEVIGDNISLVNCSAIDCNYQAIFIATKASNINISNFYSYGNKRGFIDCSTCTGLLSLDNIYDSEAYNTGYTNNISGVSNLRITNFKVMHESSVTYPNNRIFYIDVVNAWITGFITSMGNNARVRITDGTNLCLSNCEINDGNYSFSYPDIIYTTKAFTDFTAGMTFKTGTIVICRPSASGVSMHLCVTGNKDGSSIVWKEITLT